MAKLAHPSKSTDRPAKKAKIDAPTRVAASRIKGSPRPQSKPKAASPELKDTEPVITSAPIVSEKKKGKRKENFASGSNATKPTPKFKKRKNDDEAHELPSTFKVIAGSYEKLLYGLDGTTTVGDDSKLEYHMKPIFIFPAHVSCIKAVAASPHGGKWLATGSADEIVKVWDLRRRKEIGGLMHHEGSITHLTFPSRSHLLSASEDGTLCLFRARDWAVLRALRGHKGRVNAVAVHPSGKVALSVGKDKTLRMWDLMRGKGVASTKIGKEGEIVRWSTDGSLLIVQSGSVIDVYNTDMALLHTIKHSSRCHDVKFVKRVNGDGDVMLVGAEGKKLTVYEVSADQDKEPKIIAEMVGHENRVKAVQTLDIALPAASGRTSTTIVCTVSSDGNIHIYDMIAVPVTKISPVAVYDTKGTRLTCVTLGDGEAESSGATGGKRKHDDAVDDERGDAEEDGSDEEYELGLGEGSDDEDEDEQEGEQEEEGEESD
ncbi:WD40-repeat-containing domain protein [Crucibulum laeve]|uniref:WD40-repeat-containing domain protein n=1 Tax=Crucibulum laeve TaxID=68775 RepID=A0A5C3MEX9_9AGAR|nr:WD40-repeat-containing domain protein [Crucibulum laeve]